MTVPSKLTELAQQISILALNTPSDFLSDAMPNLRHADYFLTRSPRELRSTVTIDGDRGAGKTTLLHVAMLELAKRDDVVVLPIIKPEQFTDNDSLFGRVIEALADFVYVCRPELYSEPDHESKSSANLSHRFEHVASLEALTRKDATRNLTVETGIADQASDALLTTRRSSEFETTWRPFLTEVLERLGVDRLIIPVDDADLAPQHLPWLLTDLRRLDDHEAVTCIVALNSGDLTDFLRGATLRVSGLQQAEFPRIGSVVSRQIEKALPAQNWVRLHNWRPDRRLAFTDLAEPETQLESLLAGLRLGQLTVGERMRTGAGTPSQFAEALPSRPRPLQGLVAELKRTSEVQGEDAFMRSLAEHLYDDLRDSIYPLSETLHWTRGIRGLEVDLDLSQWGFFTNTDPARPKYLTHTIESSNRSLDIEYQFQRSHGTIARSGRNDSSPRISQDAVSTVLLLLDIEARDGFFRVNVSGGRPAQGGESWRRPAIICDGTPTDNAFIVPPRWEGYLEYFNLNEFLNSTLDRLGDGGIRDVPGFVEWFALAQFWMVHELHLDPTGKHVRRPRLMAKLTSEQSTMFRSSKNEWPELRKNIARQIMKSLTTAYVRVAQQTDRSRVQHSFLTWFETYLLWSLHPVIFGPDLVETFCRGWLSAIGQAGRSSEAKVAARQSLAERLHRAGAASWSDDIAILGERLDLGHDFDSHLRRSESERAHRRAAIASGVGRRAASLSARGGDLAPSPSVLSRRDREEIVAAVARLSDDWDGTQGSVTRPIDAERKLVSVCTDLLKQIREEKLLASQRRGR